MSGPAARCLAAALEYRRRGWSVLPVRPAEKRPLIKWETLQSEAASVEAITGWYRRWPDANVGIVTGAVSGLLVLDIDPKHGGETGLAAIERRCGALPPTIESRTGGGGRHLYFRHPGRIVHNRVGIDAGVDVRGDGGYVVAPPSRHPSGADYAWRPGRSPHDLEPAPLPPALLPHDDPRERAGHSFAYWRALVSDGVAQGQRNNTLASLTGHLLWHGIDRKVALELLLAWNRFRCRPPLPDAEVVQVVESIARLQRDAHPRAAPLPPES